jgi:hypothetical protein
MTQPFWENLSEDEIDKKISDIMDEFSLSGISIDSDPIEVTSDELLSFTTKQKICEALEISMNQVCFVVEKDDENDED